MPDDGLSAEARAQSVAQAQTLRKQAQEGGLRFEVYVPPQLAEWLLGLIERGVFTSPAEAAFVILGEYRELEPHADLRQACSSASSNRPSTIHAPVFLLKSFLKKCGKSLLRRCRSLRYGRAMTPRVVRLPPPLRVTIPKCLETLRQLQGYGGLSRHT